MTCETLALGDGRFAIVCHRGRGRRRCTVCKYYAPTRLCDAPRRQNFPMGVEVALDAARFGRIADARAIAHELVGPAQRNRVDVAIQRAAAGEEPTCSRALCDRCAVALAPDEDLCPPHAARAFRAWAQPLIVVPDVADVYPASALFAGVVTELARARQGALFSVAAPALEVSWR